MFKKYNIKLSEYLAKFNNFNKGPYVTVIILSPFRAQHKFINFIFSNAFKLKHSNLMECLVRGRFLVVRLCMTFNSMVDVSFSYCILYGILYLLYDS